MMKGRAGGVKGGLPTNEPPISRVETVTNSSDDTKTLSPRDRL